MSLHLGRSTTLDRRRLKIAIGLTGGILLLEAVGGYLSHSLALLSDSGHMMTDLLALLLSLLGLSLAARPATDNKTFGYYRFEILAALLNGTLLAVLSLYLFYVATRRLMNPRPVETDLMLSVAIIGLVANLVGVILLSPSRHNLNIRAALWHLLGDAFSSLGVVTGGIIMKWTGWFRVDPLISLFIGLVILWGALRLMKEACDILLEGVPNGITLREVTEAIESVEGVVGIHDLHIWSITTGMPALSGHVVVRDESLIDTDRVLNGIKAVLEGRFGICHTTLQLESRRYQETGEIHGQVAGPR